MPDAIDEESDELIRDLLLLIDEDVSLEVISTWTVGQKGVACMWAGSIYAAASDNEGVEIPERPPFLPAKEKKHG